MDEMSAAQTRWTRLMLGPCKREACIGDQRGHAPYGPVCTICGPWRSSTHCEQWSDSLGAPARYSWAFASEDSVAHYRKQESLVSQVIGFPIHDFRILPRKGNFATEPSCPRMVPLPNTFDHDGIGCLPLRTAKRCTTASRIGLTSRVRSGPLKRRVGENRAQNASSADR